MSSFEASAITHRTAGVLTRSLCAIGFSLAVSALSTQAYAGCQYVVNNQWNNGFDAKIRITNNGTSTINGWNLSWQYTGDNRITSSYNTNFGGTNPYSASNLSWNASIAPNQTVEFGFQGTKGAASAEVPTITGAVCGTSTSSAAPSSVAASSSSSQSTSSAATTAAWTLDATASYLNFVTTKNIHNVEVHQFTGLSGDISAAGVATLTIDLNTVDTGIAIRNQRMRDLLFQTAQFPAATVTVTVPNALISSLAVGQATTADISASLNLHGVTAPITTKVSVQKLSANRVLVQSLSPILTKASDYSLTSGVEALREIAGLTSISIAVPVDFALVFDAR